MDWFFHPYVLAIPFAALVIALLPDIFEKYELELTHSGLSHKANSIEYYHDLDRDGYSERLVFYNNTLGDPAMKVLRNDGSDVDQWNFDGRFPERQGFFQCGDMDNDSIEEVYLFTIKSDSLYMHCIDPLNEEVRPIKNKFISKIWKCRDTVHLFIGTSQFSDVNSDGYNDFVFAVKAGFSLQPRGLFMYDRKSDTIIRTDPLGANLGTITIDDFNRDGKKEIYVNCNTLGNIHDSLGIPYSDYSSYFMGFDHELKLLFPPLKYDVYRSFASYTPIQIDDKNYFILYFKNRSADVHRSYLKLVDTDGMIIKKVEIDSIDPRILNTHEIKTLIDRNGKKSPALIGDKVIAFLNEQLEIAEIIEPDGTNHLALIDDLNDDGQDEMLFYGADRNLYIRQNDFDDPVIINTFHNPFSGNHLCFSIKENGDNQDEVFVKSENRVYFYTYSSNPYYYFMYPSWILIYLFILFIILMIRSIQKVQLERKIEMENHLNALQLKTLKSQMDPHFMFNALNSISMSILNKEANTAYRYMVKYSHLLRMLLNKADQLAVSLKEELEFVEQYLELEQFRFENKLSYSILIQPAVDQQVTIPRLFIQLFVENAIKHGLFKTDDAGHISITGEIKDGMILILIEDNGIGRQAASKVSRGSGKGLKIIEEMISLFKKVNGRQISYHYTDLKDDDGKPSGTRVSIQLPGK